MTLAALMNLGFAGGGVGTPGVGPFAALPDATRFLHTAAEWSGGSFYFQANLKASSGTVYARFYDVTAAAEVAGSELSTTSASFVRLRSGVLTLVDGNIYEAQFARTSDGNGQVSDARSIYL